MAGAERLIEVRNLRTEFQQEGGTLHAVDGVSYHIDQGEIVAFVGESGSGKSVTQYSGLQLISSPSGRITGGEIWFEGKNLLALDPNGEGMRKVRGGKIGIVFQEPTTSLNPVMKVGKQLEESVMLHLGLSRAQAAKRAVELLRQVGIPDAERRVRAYPHQFSGGMRQRIMIAIALSCSPRLLIADEATTALDVTTQAQILELMRDIVRQSSTALAIVTHNLGIVARYADRVYVMYAGRIVESGETGAIFRNPRHPYTIGLLRALPSLTDSKERRLTPIDGYVTNLADHINRCAFAERCAFALEACKDRSAPELRAAGGMPGHFAACHLDTVSSASYGGLAVEETRKPRRAPNAGEPIVSVRGLSVAFPSVGGAFRRKAGEIRAVDGVSFDIRRGETFGLVGESGCGKSSVARALLRLTPASAGSITFAGRDITGWDDARMRPLRRDMTMIFQDPYGSLDPRQRAGDAVVEPLRNFEPKLGKGQLAARAVELLSLVGLDPSYAGRLPHEFSGGQRQRLVIARALSTRPAFIVCDEAISALDVSIQAQVINLLEDLQRELGLTYLFIAHDLSVVRHISDRVAVMYLGRIVEVADWRALYENPLHPYTKALLEAVPVPDPAVEKLRKRQIIAGEVPSPIQRPSGCAFFARCPRAAAACAGSAPALTFAEPGHQVACFEVRQRV